MFENALNVSFNTLEIMNNDYAKIDAYYVQSRIQKTI